MIPFTSRILWCASNHLLSLQGWLTALKCLRKPVDAASADQLKPGELMNELWLPVAGYEGLYEVSDQGRVRSLDREVAAGRGFRMAYGQLLSSDVNIGHRYSHRAYATVGLSKDGICKTHKVHVLVAAAFLPAKPTREHVVDHINENKLDNRACNLQWLTSSQNTSRSVVGVKNASSKLNECSVRAIRLDKRSAKVLAKEYSVSCWVISDVRSHKTWKHVN